MIVYPNTGLHPEDFRRHLGSRLGTRERPGPRGGGQDLHLGQDAADLRVQMRRVDHQRAQVGLRGCFRVEEGVGRRKHGRLALGHNRREGRRPRVVEHREEARQVAGH